MQGQRPADNWENDRVDCNEWAVECALVFKTGDVYLFWCSNSALFRVLQMIFSICLLFCILEFMIPLPGYWRNFLLNSTAGTGSFVSVLFFSGHLACSPAPWYMEMLFGLVAMVSQMTCIVFVMESYTGSEDEYRQEKKTITIFLCLLFLTHLGDTLCFIGCRNYKNIIYRIIARRNRKRTINT